MDDQIDKRLVRTFLAGFEAIIMLRHTKYGLLLSELGGIDHPVAMAVLDSVSKLSIIRPSRKSESNLGIPG